MQAHNLLAWPLNNIIFAVLVDCELFSAVVDMLESGKTEEKQPQMLDALLGHSVYLFCIVDFVMDASAALEIETGGCPMLTRG